MRLDRAGAVEPSFCRNVGFVGLYSSVKVPDVVGNSVNLDSRLPLPGICVSTKQSRLRSFLSLPLILHILGNGCLAKVRHAVVCFDAVDMVNQQRRVMPVNIEPSKTVEQVYLSVYLGSDVPLLVQRAHRLASWDVVGDSNQPRKNSGFWFVVEKFTQACCGKIIGSHAVVPFKQWFGQKPRRVISTAGLRHFSCSQPYSQGFSL